MPSDLGSQTAKSWCAFCLTKAVLRPVLVTGRMYQLCEGCERAAQPWKEMKGPFDSHLNLQGFDASAAIDCALEARSHMRTARLFRGESPSIVRLSIQIARQLWRDARNWQRLSNEERRYDRSRG